MKRPPLKALDAPPRARTTNYPEPFASRLKGREKRPLGEVFGLTNFGVNLTRLSPGMCAGFKAGEGDAHHLANRSGSDVLYLEVGDRSAGDAVSYPDDDLKAALGAAGQWRFTRKDGRPY
jgi:uncharacterized cupin superfamily protein